MYQHWTSGRFSTAVDANNVKTVHLLSVGISVGVLLYSTCLHQKMTCIFISPFTPHFLLIRSFLSAKNSQTPPSTHSPAPVDEFHWFHRQRRGNDVISVVPPSTHHDESVHLASDEYQATGADEAQQAGPHESVLADQTPSGAHRVNLQNTQAFSCRVAMATSQH